MLPIIPGGISAGLMNPALDLGGSKVSLPQGGPQQVLIKSCTLQCPIPKLTKCKQEIGCSSILHVCWEKYTTWGFRAAFWLL